MKFKYVVPSETYSTLWSKGCRARKINSRESKTPQDTQICGYASPLHKMANYLRITYVVFILCLNIAYTVSLNNGWAWQKYILCWCQRKKNVKKVETNQVSFCFHPSSSFNYYCESFLFFTAKTLEILGSVLCLTSSSCNYFSWTHY